LLLSWAASAVSAMTYYGVQHADVTGCTSIDHKKIGIMRTAF
jgi:hypothetical protein